MCRWYPFRKTIWQACNGRRTTGKCGALVHRHPQAGGHERRNTRRLGLQSAGSMLPFTVLDAAGEIAGVTTFMHIDATNRRLEIGHTWYGARVQRSPLNTGANRLGLAGGSTTS